MKHADWYFDFISPYSYLQCEQWDRLPKDLHVTCRPVLLAGLLDHWGHKGPAEIPPKRVFIYRQLQWAAQRNNTPFRFPEGHPFNPLSLLRLAIVLDCEISAIREMFRFVWRDGHLPTDASAWLGLVDRLGVDNAQARVQSPTVKQQLRDNTQRAIEQGVFGVPTFVVDKHLFWGVDATDFLLNYLRDPDLLNDPEMKRVSDLPIAAARKT